MHTEHGHRHARHNHTPIQPSGRTKLQTDVYTDVSTSHDTISALNWAHTCTFSSQACNKTPNRIQSYITTLQSYIATLLPLFSHKICQIKIRKKHKSGLEVPVSLDIICYNSSCKQMPSLLLNLSNCLTSKDFVKMSASCSSVVTCSRVTTFSSTRSLIKWCRMSICFALLCCIGFFEMLMALKLSQYNVRTPCLTLSYPKFWPGSSV